MNCKLITTSSERPKCAQLERSLSHFGYDYHIIEHKWEPAGFLGKLHETYKYLKSLEGYTYFIYTDAWDSFALADMEHVLKAFRATDCRLLISAERNCYPYAEKEIEYPTHESPWHFVNGGGWMGEIAAFIEMYEANPPTIEMNDQVWMTDRFLQHYKDGTVKLDYFCQVFQTIGFCEMGRDFDYGCEPQEVELVSGADTHLIPRFLNRMHNTCPAFIHGNGHTPMDFIYELL